MEREILDVTHYGLNIYAFILRQYSPGQTVLSVSGKQCQPTMNPFRGNKPTLQLVRNGDIFEHVDLEDLRFKGNAFDFAAYHYGLIGYELYERIRTDLNLKWRDKKPDKEDLPNLVEIKLPKMQIPFFSFFKRPISNIMPYKSVHLVNLYEYIKGDYAKSQTEGLRQLENQKQARQYKAAHFDYATFSGVFYKRADNYLIVHSGLICIDFDHVQELETLRELLLINEYFETEMLFTSPSGDGLKWIVSIDIEKHTHANYFAGLEGYILQSFGLKIDHSGKDVSRACFLPHDPEVYINPKYLIR
ncbi:MAG: VirE protein [Cytophagales bacterium]|nr:VirE protein [Cytophagales bacterium]